MAVTVSGTLFKKMVINGAINLKNNHKEVDLLNVFPVPDGDTGTNMQMTMMAGVREIENLESKSIIDISKILSRGLLMGARGNSGVILSQFFRGLYTEINKIGNGSATVKEFIKALVGGYKMAYRAVMDPVEGTILTVVREAAEKVLEQEGSLETVEQVLEAYLVQAHETLLNTPNLLPVLKEAGVVDSGGAGFIKIVEGMLMAVQGNMLKIVSDGSELSVHAAHALENVDIKFGFCTEFIVRLSNQKEFEESDIKLPLISMGDSLVVVQDEDLVKVHVHTNHPGDALNLAQRFGDLVTIKIENMRQQHSEIVIQNPDKHIEKKEEVKPQKPKVRKKYGIIAVCFGEGIKNAFKELGVDYIIDGGQTMNPPTEEFVKAIKAVHAENVIIIPNNSNVILSAEQAQKISRDEKVRVLKAKTIAQGYASLMVFDGNQTIDKNLEDMANVIQKMKSGEVTYAVRDTEIKGIKISVGDYMGITKGEIVVSTKERLQATKALLEKIVDDETEIVTIFYGVDVKEGEVEDVVAYIEELNDAIEIEVVDGQQEIYSYIIAVE